METEKKYTVMELAALIGVPRTTINDWLSRYAQYIVSFTQGKRKVYPESALNVLREIAEMRNSGKAFSDIEIELSNRHPIKAEPVQSEPEPQNTEVKENTASETVAGEGEFAVIARRQSEEIGRMIGESFRNMDQRIQELESLSRAQRKMTAVWFSAFLFFLLVLIAGGFTAWHYLDTAKRENGMLLKQHNENTEKIAALREQSVSLIAGTKTFQENIKRLESELKDQKKTFDQTLSAERKHLNELHQAKERGLLSDKAKTEAQLKATEMRLALEKEKFTAERLKLLNELNDLKAKQNEKKAVKAKVFKPAEADKKVTGKPVSAAEKKK